MEHGAKPGVGAGGGCPRLWGRPKLLKRRGGAGRPHARQTAGEGAGRRSPGRGSLGAPSPTAHRDPAGAHPAEQAGRPLWTLGAL